MEVAEQSVQRTSDGYATESQASGAVEVTDTDEKGRYIKLFNTSDDVSQRYIKLFNTSDDVSQRYQAFQYLR